MRQTKFLLLSAVLAGCAPATLDTKDTLGDDTRDADTVPDDTGDTDDSGDTDTDDTDTDPDQDNDGDGFLESEDCDDTDPETNPDAEEVFDGEDNDCDGWIDEVDVCSDPGATIQQAIDDAPDGATILICAGTWPEALILDNRELMLVGIDGADVTIVTGSNERMPLWVDGRSEVTVMGLTFADGVGEYGGAAQCRESDLHTIASVFRDSTAFQGGGIYGFRCDLTVEDTIVENNTASEQGGGILTNNCSGVLQDATIQNNSAVEGGGAFLFEGSISIDGSEFIANEATTTDEYLWGPGGGGGGLWSSSSGTVASARIADNHSNYNGGGAYFYRGNPTLEDSTIENNTCDEDGGGVYFNVSSAEVYGNTFTGNAAADDAGGLRFYYGNSVVEDNWFVGNSAGDDGGGAKFSHSEHIFRSNTLEDNSTGDAGGGLELDNDSTHVEDCTFRNNTAYRGAGLHNWRTETTFTIETSLFEGNTATDCGGGLAFDNSPYRITLSQLEITDNNGVDGAGICVDRIYRDPEDVGGLKDYFENTILRIENSAIYDNDADDDGGGMYVRAGVVDVVNAVFHDNSGPDGAALAVKGSPLTLSNSILSSNDGPALWVEDTEDGTGSIDVTWSNLWDNDEAAEGMDDPVGSNGNIDDDPEYADDEFNLESDSPCIDAGDPSIQDVDGTRSDMGMHGGPGAP